MIRIAWRPVLALVLASFTISQTGADSGAPLAPAEKAGPDRTSPAAKDAISRFEEMGGRIERDIAKVEKRWRGGESGLAVLREIPGIRKVVCYNRNIGNAGLIRLADVSSLESVELSETSVTDDGLRLLRQIGGLKEVAIYGGCISNKGIVNLAGIQTLESLALGTSNDMTYTDECFSSLAMLPRLKAITLIAPPRIKGKCLRSLRDARGIEKLSLAEMDVGDDDLTNVERLVNLRILNLRSTRITDAGIQRLAKLTAIRELNLSETKISDVGIRWLSHFTELRELWLSGIGITDEGMGAVGDLAKLEGLTLTGCGGVTNRSLAHIRKLKHLKKLTANSTGVTDEGLATLWDDLPELTIIGVKNGLPAKKGERLDRTPEG